VATIASACWALALLFGDNGDGGDGGDDNDGGGGASDPLSG